MTGLLHLRNGAARPAKTWCGKNLLGDAEDAGGGKETFTSYGNVLTVTMDPAAAACERCKTEFDAAYEKAFPNGLEPIATFKLDDPEDMERLKGALGVDALTQAFGPGGGGIAEVTQNLRGQVRK